MNWLWLTMPLAAVVFGAWLGVPVWLAIKHPDEGFPLPAMKTPVQSRAAGPAAHAIALVPHRLGLGHPPAAPRRRPSATARQHPSAASRRGTG